MAAFAPGLAALLRHGFGLLQLQPRITCHQRVSGVAGVANARH